MVNRVLHPSEIEVFYVLPALRRELSLVMKSKGKSQKDIAKLLGVTEAAVSQYLSSKRASMLKFNDKIKKAIVDSAGRISGDSSLLHEIQVLLSLIRSCGVVCDVHKSLGCPVDCDACWCSK